MRNVRKLFSVVLAVVLIFSLSVTGLAADTVKAEDVVVFATDRHDSTANLQKLLKNLEYTPGLVAIGGDFVQSTNSYSLVNVTNEINAICPLADTFYTFAAHDMSCTTPNLFNRTGDVYTGKDFYVYPIDQNDMTSTTSATTASNDFVSWANGADDGKVIFVLSHVPMHYRRRDNKGGSIWANALNKVGDSHDIVFLWGHNHTGETTSDRNAYYIPYGGTLNAAKSTSSTNIATKFTYMNAGYIQGSGSSYSGYCTEMVIKADAVVATRHSTSGKTSTVYTISRRFNDAHTCTYGEPEWIWTKTGSGYTAAAGFTCEECGETVTVTAKVTAKVETEAGCTQNGVTAYTAAASIGNITYTDVKRDTIYASGHSYETKIIAPTCTEKGFTTHTCSKCGDSYKDNYTDVVDHSYTSHVTKAASCESNGEITYTCIGCGASYTEVIPATGHNYESRVTAATCTGNGYTTHTCVNCGESYTDSYVSAKGHDYHCKETAAGCETDGSLKYTCADCGDSYTVVLPKLGHDYVYIKTVAADEETEGYDLYRCTRCGDEYTCNAVPATGHNYVEVSKVKATCTTQGYTVYKCATCGNSYKDNYVKELGHSYNSVITKNATCTETGTITYTCANCGDSYTKEVAALGHDLHVTEEPASCTESGKRVTYCSHCDYSKVDVIYAEGHDYCVIDGADADCEHNGFVTYTCSHCGDSYTDTLPAIGHSYKNIITEATCTEKGYTTHTCSKCGDSYVDSYVNATGHDYHGTQQGNSMVYTCSHCGDSYSEKISLTAVYGKASAFEKDGKFLVVMRSSQSGYYYALTHTNNTIGKTRVTVSNNEVTSTINDNMLWTYDGSHLSYKSGRTTYSLLAKSTRTTTYSYSWWGRTPTYTTTYSLALTNGTGSSCSFSNSAIKIGGYYLNYTNSSISIGTNRSSNSYIFKESFQ